MAELRRMSPGEALALELLDQYPLTPQQMEDYVDATPWDVYWKNSATSTEFGGGRIAYRRSVIAETEAHENLLYEELCDEMGDCYIGEILTGQPRSYLGEWVTRARYGRPGAVRLDVVSDRTGPITWGDVLRIRLVDDHMRDAGYIGQAALAAA